MGKLEDALENAGEGGGEGSGGGLGGMVGSGDVELQEGERGAAPEDQVAGEGTLPESQGGDSERPRPTSPQGTDAIPE